MSNKGKLTVSGLNKLNKELDEKKEIYVSQERYKVNVDQKFRPSKIHKMIITYQELIEQLSKIEDINLEVMKDLTFLLYTLIVANFTDLKIETDNVIKVINVSSVLFDTGVMQEIFDAFPKEEMEKLSEKVQAITNGNPQLNNTIGEMLTNAIANESITSEAISSGDGESGDTH